MKKQPVLFATKKKPKARKPPTRRYAADRPDKKALKVMEDARKKGVFA